MALKIRLARRGSRNRPFYSIVVADVRCPRDGRFIEKLGTYNPMLDREHAHRLVLNEERVRYWLGTGAQPTDRLARFFGERSLIPMPSAGHNPKKGQPKKKAQERLKEQAERLAAAAAEAEKERQEAEAAKQAAAAAPSAESTDNEAGEQSQPA